MVRNGILEESQVKDDVNYFSELQFPIILGGNIPF